MFARRIVTAVLFAALLSSSAVAKPILYVFEADFYCPPCERWREAWAENDSFRNTLQRAFDVRELPPEQWRAEHRRLPKPAFVVADRPGYTRQAVTGFTSPEDLLQRLGLTTRVQPINSDAPYPSKLETLHPREVPDWPDPTPRKPATPPATRPREISPEMSAPLPDAQIFREVPRDEWQAPLPPPLNISPQAPAVQPPVTQHEGPGLLEQAGGLVLKAGTTYLKAKYGWPVAIAAGVGGWLIGRRRKRSASAESRNPAAGSAVEPSRPAPPNYATAAAENIEAQKLRAELNLAQAERQTLLGKLAAAHQTIQYASPEFDDRLESFRRAMKTVSDKFPNARTWVRMFEDAYTQVRSGEQKVA